MLDQKESRINDLIQRLNNIEIDNKKLKFEKE